MHDPYGGFEYAAWEARRELLEEAKNWRLARLARPRRGLRERLAPTFGLIAGLWDKVRPRAVEDREVGEVPAFVYLSEEAGKAVEVYLGGGGCVVRKTDLRTGSSTDAFVADGRVER